MFDFVGAESNITPRSALMDASKKRSTSQEKNKGGLMISYIECHRICEIADRQLRLFQDSLRFHSLSFSTGSFYKKFGGQDYCFDYGKPLLIEEGVSIERLVLAVPVGERFWKSGSNLRKYKNVVLLLSRVEKDGVRFLRWLAFITEFSVIDKAVSKTRFSSTLSKIFECSTPATMRKILSESQVSFPRDVVGTVCAALGEQISESCAECQNDLHNLKKLQKSFPTKA